MDIETEPLEKDIGNAPFLPKPGLYSHLCLYSRLFFTWVNPTIEISLSKQLEASDLVELQETETTKANKVPYFGHLMRDLLTHYRWEMTLGQL